MVELARILVGSSMRYGHHLSLRLALIPLLGLLFVQCGDSSPPPKSATVLIYMNGTDLESGIGMGGSNGTLNLTEMMRVGSSSRL